MSAHGRHLRTSARRWRTFWACRRSNTARAFEARYCDRLRRVRQVQQVPQVRQVRRVLMSTIREQLEAREPEFPAPGAAKSAESRGQLRAEPPDPIRPI